MYRHILVVLSLMLFSCGSAKDDVVDPSGAILETYGGVTNFSAVELACLDRNPELKKIVSESKKSSDFQKQVERVPREALDCFGLRMVQTAVKGDSAAARCQQKVLIRLLTRSIEGGETNFFVALTDLEVLQIAIDECGALPK
jgi:hypothetical protein